MLHAEARDFDRQLRLQAATDRAWRDASDGYMRMEKISYRSSAGDLDVPAFVFRPLGDGAPSSRPAIVWVHEDIRGHLYEHYIPYIREAVARGYVVIAPEYRGSIGYGRDYYDAIDYGGNEVDDVVTAYDVLLGCAGKTKLVAPATIVSEAAPFLSLRPISAIPPSQSFAEKQLASVK